MYPHSLLWHYLWIAPYCLQVVIAVVMVRRGSYRELPVFFSYTVFEFTQGFLLFYLDHAPSVSPLQFAYSTWAAFLVSTVLRFALIREIVSHLLRPYPALHEAGNTAFLWSTVLLLLLAVGVSFHSAINGHPIVSGLHLANRAVSLVQVGLTLLLFFGSSVFSLSWRSYVFGIALGLGLYSTSQLGLSVVDVQIAGFRSNYLLDFVDMGIYHGCVLIWLGYLWSREPVRGQDMVVPNHELERWDAELQRLLVQ